MTWRAETVFPQLSATSRTCRFTAHLTGSGSLLRAEFTNPFVPGASYEVLNASVADTTGDGLNVRGSTAKELTFSGQSGVLVLPGARVLTDPVALPTTSTSLVAVTITASAGETPMTPSASDMGACTESPLAGPDARTAAGRVFSVPSHLMWLRALQVYGPQLRSIAAFGDSITVSPQLPVGSSLSDALTGHGAAIVNAGAGGSYLTTVGMYGTPIGSQRLIDLLSEPGLSDVVVLIGTNDLAVGVSPEHLLAAIASALQTAHARHVRMWVCTILPRESSGWSATAEAARVTVNGILRSNWLPNHGGLLIDTDATLRDPLQPSRLLPAYDSGDHLHPNAAGAHQLGTTIGLAIGLLL